MPTLQMNHLTKDKPYAWHRYEANENAEWFCEECHARVTVTTKEYGHLSDCSHRPKNMRKTWE